MLGRSSLLIAEGEHRYPRENDRNGKQPVGASAEAGARSCLRKTGDHKLECPQEKPSDEECNDPEGDLEREPEEQSRLEGRLKREALGSETSFDQFCEEKRERRKDEEDSSRGATPHQDSPCDRHDRKRQAEAEKNRYVRRSASRHPLCRFGTCLRVSAADDRRHRMRGDGPSRHQWHGDDPRKRLSVE
jgi:hypothetical protein